ncbi:hypothetical protein A7A78_01350 [Aequorivita soesokkakensis]|uniref:Uncharacterized protein n=1 Tax=Aequorivita soesokkakensis TaxID=1385699 RepID=A0A1A9LIM6_9FLAO|nr:hypothetical protein [Aequorivita soesokkakensis]OAD92581.1 hypothetical protein A7A78_01350 [Aequorivita soesokkakensis]
MKNIFFLFILMIASIGFAQNDEAFVDNLVSQKMAELELQANPERFYRKDYCEGNIQMFTLPDGKLCTSTSTYYSVYVFWKEDDKIMKLQKFDNCGSFKPISVGISKEMSKILKNKEALKTEEVKPYEGEKVDNNAFGNMFVSSCHKEYKFVFGRDAFEKSFKEFDLSNDSKYKNVNAEHNNSLELVSLDKEISELVKNFEESGKFFRED